MTRLPTNRRLSLDPELPTPAGHDWHRRARCRNARPSEFFPPKPQAANARYARTRLVFCGPCPVRTACLADALADEGRRKAAGRFGMRGGLTPPERCNPELVTAVLAGRAPWLERERAATAGHLDERGAR